MTMLEICSRLPLSRSKPRLSAAWKRFAGWIDARRASQVRAQRLRVAERVALGEKSAVSVVHVDGRRFLLASAQTSVSLIAELSPEESFSAAIKEALVMSKPTVEKPRARKPRVGKIDKEDVAA